MNPRERSLLMIAVVLLGGVVWKFLVHDPQAAQYAQLVQARDQARAELIKDQQILGREAQVRQEYARLSAFVKTMEAKLPSQKEIPPLLTTMEQFTGRIGVGLDSFHPSPLEPVTSAEAKPASAPAPAGSRAAKTLPYSKMEVTLGLTGSFAQALTYLRELRNLPRLVVVNSVSMNPLEVPRLGVGINSEIYVVGAPPASQR
ncbi:MAG TPA: type 4a pilus biogenesis protein PilO [bacterium]|nr:type 4a pilus biogenesis protein PilO [bacterium]